MADYNLKAIITGDSSGYETAVNKAKKASESLSTSISKVSKVLTSAFSVVGISASFGAITRFGKEAVKFAEDANKSLKILDNTVKVTGADTWTTTKELVGMSEEIAHTTNYTVGEIQDMQSVLLGFKNITGETFKDASDAITDMATVMGMDLKSAVQTVGKALDDPIKGLDSLRRQGFAFTEEQKEQLKQLVENGEQLKAQKIILDELNTTYGGSAKSAQSSFDKQKDAVISFKETLGNQLIPVLNVFAEKSATSFSILTEKIKTIDFSEIAGTVEYSVKVITEYFKVFYNNAKELVKGITDRFEGVEITMDSVKDTIYNVLNNIYKQMQISFGFIKSLINGDWKLAWEYAKIYVLNVCKKILDGLDGLLQKMPELVNGAIKGLNAYYEAQDKVLIEWFHLPEKFFKAPRLGTYDGKNFIDTSELQKQIDEATKIIEDATGKQVTVNLTGLEKIDEYRAKYQKKTEEGEIHLTSVTQTEVTKRVKETESLIKKFTDKLKKQLEDKEAFYSGIFTTLQDAINQMFVMLGENLVGAGHGFEAFASVALKALSEVLKSISAQLSALAVLKIITHDYANATVALAGATASMVASGVAGGIANNLTKTKEKIDAVGDSASKAGKDLEYFIKRLQEIQSGMTMSSRNLISNISELKVAYEEARIASSEAYDKWQAEIKKKPKYTYKYYGTQKVFMQDTSEIDRLYNEMQKLNDIEAEIYSKYRNASFEVLDSIKAEVSANETLIDSYNQIYKAYWELPKAMAKYSEALAESKNTFGKNDITRIRERINVNNLKSVVEEYNAELKILLNEQKESIQKTLVDIYDQLSSTGKNVGEKLISSIVNGAKKEDFLLEMKNYIRTNLIKMVVYTESFQDKLAEVGMTLSRALSEGFSGEGLIDMTSVRAQLNKLYDTAYANAQKAELIINATFGDIQEAVKKTGDDLNKGGDDLEKELARFAQLMKNFEEEVEDVGGEIGSSFVDAISEGMNQGDFLQKMKSWIKKMLVQSVVYTESMKAEIEAIGQAITKGIREGFTETSLHEIRRDLSWVFNEANKTVSSLDNILEKTFGGYAIGTNNAMGGLHLVGEAGPELVRFRGGEQVLNAGNTRKALEGMGGTTINQNVTFNNLQDTTAYSMMQQFKQYNRQMAINGVI